MGDFEFSTGDRVAWREGGAWAKHDAWGEVVRITDKGTVVVRPEQHNADELKFRPLRRMCDDPAPHYAIRKETDLEKRRREWLADAPRSSHAWPSFEFGTHDQVRGITSKGLVHTSDEARAMAKALVEVADWLDKEPKT